MERAHLATADDAAEIARLRSDLILSEPLDDHWLAPLRHDAGRAAGARRRCPRLRHRRPDQRTRILLARPHPPCTARPELRQGPRGTHTRRRHRTGLRRRGCGKATLAALLDRLERDGVTLCELYASEGSAPLYAGLGFASNPALMRMTHFPAPSSPGTS